AAAERARAQQLEAGALKGDAERAAAHTQREAADATTQVERLSSRLAEVEARLATVRAELERHEVERVRLDERLGAERARLVELEAQQEAAREQRVHWQVEAAQVEAHLAAARARAERAGADAAEARRQSGNLADEMGTIDHDVATQTAQQSEWTDAPKERRLALGSFGKVREHFRTVFQTLFGGGECDVRLANEDEPLESEIEIHAAPRGKRTQRIHLLSSGERTLVAVSLLFAIFLTKPSPFCLLDEVDAPLDDANVGRYVRLLAEFKDLTQFIVITHNPRTMQAA